MDDGPVGSVSSEDSLRVRVARLGKTGARTPRSVSVDDYWIIPRVRGSHREMIGM